MQKHVQQLLEQRYFHPSDDGKWENLVDRVINHIYKHDNNQRQKELARSLILDRVFLLNSPALVNSGTRVAGLFACFTVGPREDSLEAHMETLKDIAEVGKAGGGCGFTGTFIRKEGSPVAGSAHGYAYGPNALAITINNTLDMITQGGFRKMALMYTMRSDHEDLEKFIDLKQSGDESHGARFNQSIMATDAWMEKALWDKESEEHRLLKKVAYNIWNNGEPGFLFRDRINENTPYKICGCDIEVTNPCGEQPLPDYGSCNLGSFNLAHPRLLDADDYFTELADMVRVATRILDNVGVVNRFPNAKFADWYDKHRPIGLGVMGLADLFIARGIAYGSQESLDLTEKIFKVMYETAHDTSKSLGLERGVPEHCIGLGRRNATLLTVAPTGSISFLAECSSGIEPIFSPSYTRIDERGERYSFKDDRSDLPYFRSTINDDKTKIPSWKAHLGIQEAAQRYVDSGISKTINLENSATAEEVYQIIHDAYANGIAKGITMYRAGSRDMEVLVDDNASKSEWKKRPNELEGIAKYDKPSNTTIIVGLRGGIPYEVFGLDGMRLTGSGTIKKTGSGHYDWIGNKTVTDITQWETPNQAQITRLASLLLRSNIEIGYILDQLEKSKNTINSFALAISRSLKPYAVVTASKCPECESHLTRQEGCLTCIDCGYSKC